MSKRVLFPNAIDYVRTINQNVVDNLLAGRAAFVKLPSLYNRAYIVVHETGEVPVTEYVEAPDESIGKINQVDIITKR